MQFPVTGIDIIEHIMYTKFEWSVLDQNRRL